MTTEKWPSLPKLWGVNTMTYEWQAEILVEAIQMAGNGCLTMPAIGKSKAGRGWRDDPLTRLGKVVG